MALLVYSYCDSDTFLQLMLKNYKLFLEMELALLGAHEHDHSWLHDAAEVRSTSIQKCVYFH